MATIENPVKTLAWMAGIFIALFAASVGWATRLWIDFLGLPVPPAGFLGLDPVLAGLLTVFAIGIVYAYSQGDTISLTFAATTVVATLIAMKLFVPEAVLAELPIAPLVESTRPFELAIVLTFALAVWYIVDIRFLSMKRKTPNKVAEQVVKQFQRLFETYLSITRVVIAAIIGLATVALAQAGILATDVFGWVSEAPLVVSNFVAGFAGYFGLGGGVPAYLAWIPGLDALTSWFTTVAPASYLIFVLIVLALAYAARESLLDYEEKIQKERSRRREAEHDE